MSTTLPTRLGVCLALAVLVVTAGCDTDDTCSFGADVRMNFTGFDEHVGELFKLRINPDGFDPSDPTSFNVPGPEFTTTWWWYCDERIEIDFFVDVNGNGHYDPPPTDHAWRINTKITDDPTIITFEHNSDYVDIHWWD